MIRLRKSQSIPVGRKANKPLVLQRYGIEQSSLVNEYMEKKASGNLSQQEIEKFKESYSALVEKSGADSEVQNAHLDSII